ncbi:uncharacterized protein LOC128723967 [Anopheles nili]|uniref:uncharacterized protein LOC128723967 n=1 Tax=Anopheles nili TaxID=185578 RepID=UPI00237BB389|nr:uncharacterized protein LOC128723967 [Anopheles nili]
MNAEWAKFALANVTCEYELNSQQAPQDGTTVGRRVRRSEELLRQASEFVSRGETFQNVSHKFDIPISTIRFYMARKGILPRRKRGRTAMYPSSISNRHQLATIPTAAAVAPGSQIHLQQYHQQLNENMAIAGAQFSNPSTSTAEEKSHRNGSNESRSPSPSGPPFHFANYKLPDLRSNLL